jgi:hypothetical protein
VIRFGRVHRDGAQSVVSAGGAVAGELSRRSWPRTLANLSKLPGYVIDGLKALLKGGTVISTGPEEMQVERSLPHGHVAASLGMLRRIALDRLILSTAEGRGVATVLPSGGGDDRGSKLGFVRAVDGTAGRHRTRACPHPSRRSAAGTRGCAVPPRLPGGRRRAEQPEDGQASHHRDPR